MHDPLTVAFEIKYPWKNRRTSKWWPNGYRDTLITIWHKDPETDGTDDSCGWFKRARHGDKGVLEKIVKRFGDDWDRTFDSEGKTFFCGMFAPNGDPLMGTSAIVLNLFFLACIEALGSRERAVKFCRKNLFDILLFAENPFDSLHNEITGKFGVDDRKSRIESLAEIVYGWILRAQQPWWKHPRWHFWHWRFQVHPLQKAWRWTFRRCAICGKRLGYNESAIGNWDGDKIWHQGCDRQNQVPIKESHTPAA